MSSGVYSFIPSSSASSSAGSPPTPQAPFGQPFSSYKGVKLVPSSRLVRYTVIAALAVLAFIGSLGLSHRSSVRSHVAAAFDYAGFSNGANIVAPVGSVSSKHRYVAPPDLVAVPLLRSGPQSLLYPPEINAANLNPYQRANAAIVSLVRNEELGAIQESMRSLEERFNRKFGYPWVFMNNVPFTEEFKKGVRKMTRSEVLFSLIPTEHWSYPSSINQTYAAETRAQMEKDGIIYGGSESYRMMCRFNSGFFYRQEVLAPYDFYFRVEPGVEYGCDVEYDPFLFMQANEKVYGFTISMYEYEATIKTLWETVKAFARLHPEHIAPDNALGFMVDGGISLEGSKYNLCHFWSNFEIADLNFWRGQAYTDFFNYLDATGNFFYERWGDAPVHSIAVALFLPKSKLHQFDDIAYRHNPFTHCPKNPAFTASGKCSCEPTESFAAQGYSCMPKWWAVTGGEPSY